MSLQRKSLGKQPSNAILLGIEGGGTRTVALWADIHGALLKKKEFGPANFKLLSSLQLQSLFKSVAKVGPPPSAVAIGLAGARTPREFEAIRSIAGKVWKKIPLTVTNDLETALHADLDLKPVQEPKVLVLSGTGSVFFGQTPDGRTARFGGWGHLLGDKGSGYEIGLRALKAAVFYWDRDKTWSLLGNRILQTLQLNEPDDLVHWAQNAAKQEIAALSKEVFAAAGKRDAIARDILTGAAHSLARDANACARKLAGARGGVTFLLAGGVLLNHPGFAAEVSRLIKKLRPGSTIRRLSRESAWGAVQLAANSLKRPMPPPHEEKFEELSSELVLTQSPTEQRHPKSMNLDKLPLGEAIALMLREDEKIPVAVLAERRQLERAVSWIIQSFKNQGRLFYVGAGTSGRLGVLDASECPPTFRSPPEQVQGIIAGGLTALFQSVEGAEDDPEGGRRAIRFRAVGKKDVVVGIAASGRTPFVLGALEEAKARKAKTIFICFNPQAKVPAGHLIINPSIGPEILTGSTRLKAGTATKLILNIFTTLAMVKCGKVVSNLMIDVKASNKKLKLRAIRIVQELTGLDAAAARAALAKSNWIIKDVLGPSGHLKG